MAGLVALLAGCGPATTAGHSPGPAAAPSARAVPGCTGHPGTRFATRPVSLCAWQVRGADEGTLYWSRYPHTYQYYWQQRLSEFRGIPPGTEFTLQNLAPDRLIVGDPESCVREFHRWREATGADYFLLRLRHAHSGGPAHEKIMDAITLFGDRVLPYCR